MVYTSSIRAKITIYLSYFNDFCSVGWSQIIPEPIVEISRRSEKYNKKSIKGISNDLPSEAGNRGLSGLYSGQSSVRESVNRVISISMSMIFKNEPKVKRIDKSTILVRESLIRKKFEKRVTTLLGVFGKTN